MGLFSKRLRGLFSQSPTFDQKAQGIFEPLVQTLDPRQTFMNLGDGYGWILTNTNGDRSPNLLPEWREAHAKEIEVARLQYLTLTGNNPPQPLPDYAYRFQGLTHIDIFGLVAFCLDPAPVYADL